MATFLFLSLIASAIGVRVNFLQNPVAWGFNGDFNKSALQEFNAWDLSEGWSSRRPGLEYADSTKWPVFAQQGGWDLGLTKPRAVVLSMRQRVSRRHSFKKQFEAIGWNLGAEWAAAVDGNTFPSNLRWLNGHPDLAWDSDKPGNWGCYLSHLAILREHQAKCSACDLMVFEDDAVFVPKFEQRWKAFFAKLPQDWSIVRLGAESLWEPSFLATADYVQAKAVANTWGYVVRANAVKQLADLLAGLPVKGDWGVDAVMQLFTKELLTYVPTVPLVYAVGSCSDSSAKAPGHGCKNDDDAALQERITELYAKWPQGYTRTYCNGKGTLHEAHQNALEATGCAGGDLSQETCCPYLDPPNLAM